MNLFAASNLFRRRRSRIKSNIPSDEIKSLQTAADMLVLKYRSTMITTYNKFALCILACYGRNLLSLQHTWGKYSLVHQIIQHVEYLVQTARVNKSSQNVTAHWGNLFTLRLVFFQLTPPRHEAICMVTLRQNKPF